MAGAEGMLEEQAAYDLSVGCVTKLHVEKFGRLTTTEVTVTLKKTRPTPAGAVSFQVASTLYATERWASPDRLRPRWRFGREVLDGVAREVWRAEAPEGLIVFEMTDEQPPPAHTPTSAPLLPTPQSPLI